ncbi:hypothetical protein [Chamaesiphon sp. OTE_75_metabat_556]|nr:hypothetical protein [Chamaesiphon sp. OTE_75_metabat_556]
MSTGLPAPCLARVSMRTRCGLKPISAAWTAFSALTGLRQRL